MIVTSLDLSRVWLYFSRKSKCLRLAIILEANLTGEDLEEQFLLKLPGRLGL